MLAIISGLNNVSVMRLKKSWKALPNKSLDTFCDLEVLMDNKQNYRAYRKKLSEVSGPTLPYFGMLMYNEEF